MKTIKQLVASFLILAFLQSCITIEENYKFNKNGSGSLEYVIDMSELGDLMDGMESEDANINDKQKNSMDSIYNILVEMDNLKNVTNNSEEWISRIAFDFEDVYALNAALKVISNDGATWTKSGKRWTRKQMQTDGMPLDGGTEDEELAAGMLESMEYKITVQSPKKISGYDGNQDAYKANGKKSIEVKTNFSDLIDNPQILSFSINAK